IQVDLNLADFAAVDLHRGDAVDLLDEGLQLVFDRAARDIRRLGRADREHHDRQGGDVEALDRGIFDLAGQRAANGGDLLAYFRGGLLRIDFEPQLDAD